MSIVDELLAGMDRDAIMSGAWTQQAVVIPGGAKPVLRYVAKDAIVPMLRRAIDDTAPANVRIVDNARPMYSGLARIQEAVHSDTLTQDVVDQACGRGTLVINGIHRYHDGAMALMRELFDGFAEAMTLNLYYSPQPGTPGLGVHYDRWEIFAAHLSGSKHWRAWPATIEHPVDFRVEEHAEVRKTPPLMERTVRGGDILFLPRGAWHLAEPTDEPSLHLTIGVHVKKGVDVAHWLFAEAAKQTNLRANLPSDGNDAQLDGAAAAIRFVRERLDDDNAAAAFLRYQFIREYADTFGALAPGEPAGVATMAAR